MNRPFVDVDALVREDTGQTSGDHPPAGEAAFRDIESRLLKQAAERRHRPGYGGGAVLREENRIALSMNSRVYWLQRPLEELKAGNRPLSKNLPALYEARKSLYEAVSDAAVDGTKGPETAVLQVMEEFR